MDSYVARPMPLTTIQYLVINLICVGANRKILEENQIVSS